uniref:Uncharacterized protein n=2 Tax=Candidatus Kentrum sp. FM TaxID=2126340 RepID=A0A450THR7_9GAMM|nr:MAG: hypothetical protein BECKFM1743C_GA0114222_104343 [Candidatus Kentron sp. FM]
MYAFHAVISIRYWFAIDIAIRYRYRSYPAFSIASSDIDSDPERTTTPVAAWLRYALREFSGILADIRFWAVEHPKVISVKEHTSLLVLLPSFCVAMTVI